MTRAVRARRTPARGAFPTVANEPAILRTAAKHARPDPRIRDATALADGLLASSAMDAADQRPRMRAAG